MSDYITIQCPSCGVLREYYKYYTGMSIRQKRWCKTCNITFNDFGIVSFSPPTWEVVPVEDKPKKDRLILI